MLGRDHLVVSLLTAAVIAWPLYDAGVLAPVLLAVFLTGVFLGSLAPDADAEDAAVFHKASGPRFLKPLTMVFGWVLPLFGFVLKWLVFEPLSLLLGGKHRGWFHSLAGLFASSVMAAVLAGLAASWFSFFSWFGLAVFTGGFALGFLLHLAEDACTVSGVKPFYPFSQARLSGTLKTGVFSWRLFVFEAALVLPVAGLYGFQSRFCNPWTHCLVTWSGWLWLWVIFVFLCGVRKK